MILFKKIRNLVQNNVWQKLFGNFLSLSIYQALNFITEIIILVYLTNTLGANNYGLVSFAISFILFFQIITEYGFEHSGTRAISKYRDDPQKLKKIYSSVNYVKIILSCICFIILLIVVSVFEIFRENFIIYFLLFGLILQSILFPMWFFRGIEKMKYITIINFIGKGGLVALIILFINSPTDYVLYPLFVLIIAILVGFISQIFIYKKYKMKFEKITLPDIKFQFSMGFFMFLVYFSTNIINNLNPFILGLLTDYTDVGIFTTGYRIILIFVLIISLITTTVFPHIVKLVSESNKQMEDNVFKFIKKVLLIIILVGVASFIFLFVFADLITETLFISEYRETVNVIRILSVAPLLIGIGHTLTLQILVPLEFDSPVAIIYGVSAIVDLILCFIFIPIFGYLALCFIILIIRTIPIILALTWIKKNRTKLNLISLEKKSF
ncbi:MAG: oligosaccharide flippase family protein [Promethearchaeota archaeon]